MSNYSLFENFYHNLDKNVSDKNLNYSVDIFVSENGKEYFLKEDIYNNFDNCQWIEKICKDFGASALTLFLAKMRSASVEWKGVNTYNKNINIIKIKITQVISKLYNKKLNFKCQSGDSKRLLILLPILPTNKNNNISNIVLSYLATLQQKFSDKAKYKLIITNELIFNKTPDSSQYLSDLLAYQNMLKKYGGDEKDLICLPHTENLPEMLIEECNKFSPTHVFVPNFELTCSYLALLKEKCFCMFMQTNIHNQTPYDFDLYLSCGKVEDVPKQALKGRYWKRFRSGYPKFGFLGTSIKKNMNFRIVFVSNRVERELTKDFLIRIDKIMDQYCNVEFHVLGVRDNNIVHSFLVNSISENNLKNVKLVGYIDHIGDYLDTCDVYMNPSRLGGGVSMALSLYANTPVLINGVSDASNFLGGVGISENYEQQFKQLERCISNQNELSSLLAQQQTYFFEHNSLKAVANQIIDCMYDFNR